MVETKVEFRFVEFAHGLVYEVEGTISAAKVCVGRRVEIDQSLADAVGQAVRTGGDFVAVSSSGLASIRVRRQGVP